ncbi:MAG TPA: hypothetical protein VN256_21950 [Pyrinomonadaceae bacterium]|nr:hypothetical protein [Pyrinomonadaceae bacterium]
MKYQSLSRYLRAFGWNGFTRPTAALALALLLPVAASAYTVVLRSGRRVEIPAAFTVTKLTLTYEAAPGINVTLQMATIDIPATERANNEPAGALLRRAERPATSATGAGTAAQPRAPRRELTRQDIESARAARAKSEQDYERRRVELGLPSREETRRRTEEETRRLGEMSRQAQAEEAQAESYWRARSSELRNEMATVDAEINYVSARLAEMPAFVPTLWGYGGVTGGVPFSVTPAVRFPVTTGNPGFMRGTKPGVPQAGFLAFGGIAAQGHVPVNPGLLHRPIRPGLPRGGFGRRGIHRRGIGVPAAPFFGVPYGGYDYYSDQANLVSRLRELESARASLRARWRLLEEDARRAGALPGWLRE